MNLLHPKSVIDIGCGLGEWLAVFQNKGVKKILGMDGTWVDINKLQIAPSEYQTVDLMRPLIAKEHYDLVVSLEVGEHLPRSKAQQYVHSLTQHSNFVLFSAAIPYQGGVHHVNEQWPEYWAKLFAREEFVPVDAIRKKIWGNEDVCYWYQQNILLFVHKKKLQKNKKLKELAKETNPAALAIVHPKKFLTIAQRYAKIARFVPEFLKRPLIKLLKKI